MSLLPPGASDGLAAGVLVQPEGTDVDRQAAAQVVAALRPHDVARRPEPERETIITIIAVIIILYIYIYIYIYDNKNDNNNNNNDHDNCKITVITSELLVRVSARQAAAGRLSRLLVWLSVCAAVKSLCTSRQY